MSKLVSDNNIVVIDNNEIATTYQMCCDLSGFLEFSCKICVSFSCKIFNYIYIAMVIYHFPIRKCKSKHICGCALHDQCELKYFKKANMKARLGFSASTAPDHLKEHLTCMLLHRYESCPRF